MILAFGDVNSPLIPPRLSVLKELGGEVVVVANADCKEILRSEFRIIKPHCFKNRTLRYIVNTVFTFWIILNYRPKLIVVHWASRLWQSAVLALFGSRVIVHTMNGDINPMYDGNGKKKKFTSFLLSRAAAITVKVRYNLTLIENNFSQKLLDKTHVISWGVERSLLECERVDIRSTLGVCKNSKIIFCPRSMQAIYHKKEIVRAFFEYLDDGGENAYLVVSTVNSHSKYMDEYESFVGASRYAKNVIFVSLKHEEMASFLHQSDVVLSFTKSDGLSQTIMEGLAIGARIVCYEMPDYEGILFHGKNSFLFQDTKGIKEGIKYFADKNNTIKTVDTVMNMLDYEIQKQKYIKLCKSVMAGEKN